MEYVSIAATAVAGIVAGIALAKASYWKSRCNTFESQSRAYAHELKRKSDELDREKVCVKSLEGKLNNVKEAVQGFSIRTTQTI